MILRFFWLWDFYGIIFLSDVIKYDFKAGSRSIMVTGSSSLFYGWINSNVRTV